jgi:hypothetical protein
MSVAFVTNPLQLTAIYGSAGAAKLMDLLARNSSFPLVCVDQLLPTSQAGLTAAERDAIDAKFKIAYWKQLRPIQKDLSVVVLIGGALIIPFQKFCDRPEFLKLNLDFFPSHSDYAYSVEQLPPLTRYAAPHFLLSRIPDELGYADLGLSSTIHTSVLHDPLEYSESERATAFTKFFESVERCVEQGARTIEQGGESKVYSVTTFPVRAHAQWVASNLPGKVESLPLANTSSATVAIFEAHGDLDSTSFYDDSHTRTHYSTAISAQTAGYVVCHAGDLFPHDSGGPAPLLHGLALGGLAAIASPCPIWTGRTEPKLGGRLIFDALKAVSSGLPVGAGFFNAIGNAIATFNRANMPVPVRALNSMKTIQLYGDPMVSVSSETTSDGVETLKHSRRRMQEELNKASKIEPSRQSERQPEKQEAFLRKRKNLKALLESVKESLEKERAEAEGIQILSEDSNNLLEWQGSLVEETKQVIRDLDSVIATNDISRVSFDRNLDGVDVKIRLSSGRVLLASHTYLRKKKSKGSETQILRSHERADLIGNR